MKVLIDINHLNNIVHDLVNIAHLLKINTNNSCEDCKNCEIANKKISQRLVNLRTEILQSVKDKKGE